MKTLLLIIFILFLLLSIFKTKLMFNLFWRPMGPGRSYTFTGPFYMPKLTKGSRLYPQMTGEEPGDNIIIWMIRLFSLAILILLVYAAYLNHH